MLLLTRRLQAFLASCAQATKLFKSKCTPRKESIRYMSMLFVTGVNYIVYKIVQERNTISVLFCWCRCWVSHPQYFILSFQVQFFSKFLVSLGFVAYSKEKPGSASVIFIVKVVVIVSSHRRTCNYNCSLSRRLERCVLTCWLKIQLLS